MVRAYLGLGSNIGDRAGYLRSGLLALEATDGIDLERVSAVYETAPVGKLDQPDFLNAVAAVNTTLSAADLLQVLQAIEQTHQRQRSIHWGPRTLDLDILLFADQVVSTPTLQLPHPHLTERAFVLVPLVELDPGLIHPQFGRLLADYPAASAAAAAIRKLGPLKLKLD